jgi:hypothetical protein
VLVFYFSRKGKEKKGCQETESEGGNCKNRKYVHAEKSREKKGMATRLCEKAPKD